MNSRMCNNSSNVNGRGMKKGIWSSSSRSMEVVCGFHCEVNAGVGKGSEGVSGRQASALHRVNK